MKLRFWRSEPPEQKSSIFDDWLTSNGLDVALSQLVPLSLERAVGLPALLGVLLRLGQGVGMIPQLVYRGDGPERDRARDTWQWELLHKRPSSEATPSLFRGDLALAAAGIGNGYVRKFKGGSGRVRELIMLDSRNVKVERRNGRKIFIDRTEDPKGIPRDASEIIHVRGLAVNGQLEGLSPITATRLFVQTALKRQSFEWNHYDNDATPGGVFKLKAGVDVEQAQEWMAFWNAQHQGHENRGRWAAIGGIVDDIEQLPINLADAQFVEVAQLTARQICGIYGVPPALLGLSEQSPTDADRMQFVTFGLGWILTAIDEAFNADADLFPAADDLMCEHLADALLRPDTATRYRAYKDARQGSWVTANEVRAKENLPPIEGGDEILITPVGAAPNPSNDDRDDDK